MKNGRRSRNLFSADSATSFKLSRSKIEMFLRCPRCFYLDRRLGISQPSTPPFTLNNAVDYLLKKEFDAFRVLKKPHPLMIASGIDAVPYASPLLDGWRDNKRGVQFVHFETNFLVFGAVDDVWEDTDGRLLVVDYKATSSEREVTLDDAWKDSYKRQMEIYQWLLLQNGYPVSETGYFVFVNASKAHDGFNGRLEFVQSILPYTGDSSWVDDALIEANKCLCAEKMPAPADDCEWCQYREAAQQVEEKKPSEKPSLFDVLPV